MNKKEISEIIKAKMLIYRDCSDVPLKFDCPVCVSKICRGQIAGAKVIIRCECCGKSITL